jgi:hypothetical protein
MGRWFGKSREVAKSCGGTAVSFQLFASTEGPNHAHGGKWNYVQAKLRGVRSVRLACRHATPAAANFRHIRCRYLPGW